MGPLLLALLLASGALAGVLEGRVVRIIDGDSIEVRVTQETIEIRLAGIDAPERGQPWTDEARQALSDRVYRKPVRIIEVDVDRYGRPVGEVYADDVCVGCELVREGHVWVYRQYTDDAVLIGLEDEARAARRGLWSLPETQRIPPWAWRRGQRPPPPAGSLACGGEKRCADLASCEEARFQLETCGVAGLDGDGDGVPCEALCGR